MACLVVLAAVISLAPVAGAQPDPVRSVVLDLFQEGDVGTFQYETPCEGSTFSVDPESRSFTFHDTTQVLPTGRPALACGEARWRLEVPPGADHVHVRFEADRTLEDALLGAPAFLQEVWIEDANGARLARFPYFQESEQASERVGHDDLMYSLAGSSIVQVVWVFAEQDEAAPGIHVPSQVAATVWGPAVEFSGVPVRDASTHAEERRTGSLIVDEVRVRAIIDRAILDQYEVVLRVAAHPELAFHEAALPSGARLRDATTRNDTASHDHQGILVERSPTQMQVYVPAGVTAPHGAGTYEVTLRAVSDVRVVQALVPVVFVLVLLPVPFAVAAVVGVATFEREAFGGFRRSAHVLRLAVLTAVLYYVVVVVSAFVGGRLPLMATWPMGTEGVLLYLQVAVAIAAFLLLWLVARELARITRPRRGEP